MPSKIGGAAVTRGQAATKTISGSGLRPVSGSRPRTAIMRASEVATAEGSIIGLPAEDGARSGRATGPTRTAIIAVFRRRGGTAGTSNGLTPTKGQAAT